MSTSLSQPKALGKPHWSHAMAIATTAAVVVLVAIGGFVLFARTGGDEVAPVAPVADVSLLEGTWERTVIDELDPYVHFEDMKVTSFGFVASAVLDGVWISEDGVEWHQALAVPYEPSDLPPETVAPPMTVPPHPGHVETYVRLVAEYNGALYATGNVAIGQDTNTPDTLEGSFLVWRSDDGSRWDEIALESAHGEMAAHPLAMTAADDALFIFADDGSVYRSEDGGTFARFDLRETGITSAFSAVAQFGSGFVAIGEAEGDEASISHVYASPDGTTWTQVPGSEFPVGHYPYTPLVEFDGALYVGGMTFMDDAAGAVWRSIDGEAFTAVDLGVRAPFGSSGDETMAAMYGVEDLIVTPHGMLVVGHVPGPVGNHADVVLLATSDGIRYDPVLATDGAFTGAVQTSGAFFDGSITMVGHEPDSDVSQGIAYQWVWTP